MTDCIRDKSKDITQRNDNYKNNHLLYWNRNTTTAYNTTLDHAMPTIHIPHTTGRPKRGMTRLFQSGLDHRQCWERIWLTLVCFGHGMDSTAFTFLATKKITRVSSTSPCPSVLSIGKVPPTTSVLNKKTGRRDEYDDDDNDKV
jgi:hypothetical protein